jgi:hypothetical protein
MKAFAEADRAKDMHGPNVAGPKATGTKYWSEIWIRLVCAVLLACHAERRHAVSSRYHVNAWISPAHASPLTSDQDIFEGLSHVCIIRHG